MRRWLEDVWYGQGSGGLLLRPLGALFAFLVGLRRRLFAAGVLPRHRAGAPVIVVGNINVGGTGKTPLTLWLARRLAERGRQPGVISRGYGGEPGPRPLRVEPGSDPARVGDEALIFARHADCPVYVHPDRVAAARAAVEAGADVIIADDGLQHYRLARDYEIAVVDFDRGLGNGRCLPAGPLREPPARLDTVDQVFSQGLTGIDHAIGFTLRPEGAVNVADDLRRDLAEFSGQAVYAIAGIGNPARFFRMLRDAGMKVIEHPLADHAEPSRQELDPPDTLPVFMTEKDAVKVTGRAGRRHWYVPVSVDIDAATADAFLERLDERLDAAR
ncbi:tetraacyldisaccharide 4'-kinase [Lentisalinibacter sediminis]|uniref:tetraacyldisaccharide 4'-kinase n=1 Tax=Lentisalinibacter sediminis TaxID=2992237 RepID=UPI00386E75EF